MIPSVLVLCIPQLLVSIAGAVANVEDEQCLLQTNIDTHTRRSVNRHSDAPAEPVVEPQEEPSKVPQFSIDLDKAPEERFNEVSKKLGPAFKEFFETFGNNAGMLASVKKIASLRGEETPEMAGEIRGIAKSTDIPEYFIQGTQFIPSLQCLKGPFLKFVNEMNVTLPADGALDKDTPSAVEFLDHFQVPSFGSAGIIAKDKDGSVWHARNLGYAMPRLVQKFTYNAKFFKKGKELYTAQMVYPALVPFTAVRRGKNGYSWQANTRYLEEQADGMMLMKNLYMERRNPGGWQARKVFEDTDNYDDAVKAFSTMKLPSPEYIIMSGVKKGTILARDPDSVAYKMELDEKHPYLIMTNFDYINGDKKEWLQPTRVKGLSARVRAQNLLDQSEEVTPKLLKDVLNDRDVLSNNVLYQALINVEHDEYQASLPHCGNCDAAVPQGLPQL
jgi:N-acylethanolamine-hydrolysing acid amidase